MRPLTPLLAACIFLVVACTPRPVAPPLDHKLPAPPQRESAQPALASALRAAAEAAAEAQRARDSVDRAQTAAATAQAAAKTSVAEAKRLLEQKTATENELLTLYNLLVEQEKGLSVLTADIGVARNALIVEKRHSGVTLQQLQLAETRALAKEAEADELRRLLTYSESLTAQATKTAKDAINASESLRTEVGIAKGSAKTWRNITYGTGVLLLLSLGAHVLRSYMRI